MTRISWWITKTRGSTITINKEISDYNESFYTYNVDYLNVTELGGI